MEAYILHHHHYKVKTPTRLVEKMKTRVVHLVPLVDMYDRLYNSTSRFTGNILTRLAAFFLGTIRLVEFSSRRRLVDLQTRLFDCARPLSCD